MHVERRLQERRAAQADPGVLPMAVIADLDDTVLDTRDLLARARQRRDRLLR
jgi:hypothetical protein